MTNKEFVTAVKDGNIEKVKKGLKDPKVNPTAWNSRALQYAHNEIVHNAGNRKVYGEIIDLLVQNSDVDPSIDTFIVTWAPLYCERKTIEKMLNHPGIISNSLITTHSGQMAQNAFERGRDDILKLVLNHPMFDINEAFKLSSWDKKIGFIKWCVDGGVDLKNIKTEYIERALHAVSSSIEDGSTQLLMDLFDKSDFPKNFNKNYFAIVAYHAGEKELVEWFKKDPAVVETAVQFMQEELLNKELVDMFLF